MPTNVSSDLHVGRDTVYPRILQMSAVALCSATADANLAPRRGNNNIDFTKPEFCSARDKHPGARARGVNMRFSFRGATQAGISFQGR